MAHVANRQMQTRRLVLKGVRKTYSMARVTDRMVRFVADEANISQSAALEKLLMYTVENIPILKAKRREFVMDAVNAETIISGWDDDAWLRVLEGMMEREDDD